MKLSRNTLLVSAATLMSLVAIIFVFFVNQNTDGTVRELVNSRPISDARIKLKCYRSTFPHGSELIRTVETISRSDGNFSFSSKDVRGCSHLSASTEKDGFRNAADIKHSAIRIEFEINYSVPRNLYMVRESEVKKLQLDGLFNESNGTSIWPTDSNPTQEYIAAVNYGRVHKPFADSIRIASTPEEILWVQERYCDRLLALWSKIQTLEYQKYVSGDSSSVKYSDILLYCQKKPT